MITIWVLGIQVHSSFNNVNMYDTDDLISRELTSRDASFVKIIGVVNGNNSLNYKKEEFSSNIDLDTKQFASIFRYSAPYIAMHRGSIMVIHIGGYIFQNKSVFDDIMDDISILQLLGIKLVLVIGVRDQLDERIKEIGL